MFVYADGVTMVTLEKHGKTVEKHMQEICFAEFRKTFDKKDETIRELTDKLISIEIK